MSNDTQHVKVYVRDQAYAWLPGSIVFIKEGKAFVRIELPLNWHSSTVLCQDSGLEDVEDALVSRNENNKKPNAFRAVPLASYPNGQLPLQNKCGHKSNMTALPHLHEAAMLYNLKERNTIGKPYTRVRDVIVAMNPFIRNENLHSLEVQRFYANQLVWARGKTLPVAEEEKEDTMSAINGEVVEPHIYEVACLAYRGLFLNNQDQTILVTGESGSGKTETVKILLYHLATLESLRPPDNSRPISSRLNIVNKVRHSSAVLEVFGNAKTRRNNNSSRFGKLAQMQFRDSGGGTTSPSFSLIGSVCRTYLLEKSRVVSHAVGERNFHVFYQLLAAPEEFKEELWPFFAPLQPTDFSYLSQHGECEIVLSEEREKWSVAVNAFREFGIQGDLLLTIMRTMATVLQLGNLQFDEAQTDSGERTTMVTSKGALETLAKMFGIEQDELEMALTSRSIKTNFEELRAPLRPAAAKKATDALAKEIYSSGFGFLVRHVNEHMKAAAADAICGIINLVDICGFERLAVNRFEQLCINYANEQLQQKYVADNFRILKEEYDQEGIDIFDFSLVDNSAILNLIDGRSGVFVALQEECIHPMGSDTSFVEKVKSVHNSHPHFINEKLHSKTEFGIRHFAGPVTYDATKFVEHNMDKLPEELLSCTAKTSNSLIRTEMQRVSQERLPKSKPDEARRKINGLTTIEKFSTELMDLLVALEGTHTRHCRCIIPNETMSPGVTNHLMTLRQLECAGLMTSVALTRESLPDRLSYKTLLARFGVLLERSDRQKMKEMDLADQIVYLLTNLFVSMLHGEEEASMPFACGRTKAYLRSGALEHLERLRYRFYFFKALAIQKWIRAAKAADRFHVMRTNAIQIQSIIRAFIARQKMRRLKSAALLLSSWLFRQKVANLQRAAHSNLAALTIQTMWRAQRSSSKYRTHRRAVIAIQRIYRVRTLRATPANDSRLSLEPSENNPPDPQDEFEPSEIAAIKERIALRKVALPRYRRADQVLLADIDFLLTSICAGGYLVQTTTESSSLDEVKFLQGENESLRKECKHLKERTRMLSATIEELRGTSAHPVLTDFDPFEEAWTTKEEVDMRKDQHEMTKLSYTVEVPQLQKQATATETEIKRLKKELDLLHQHNEEVIAYATESQEAREMLTREIANLNEQFNLEGKKQRDALQLLEKELSDNQALRREETTKLKEELRLPQQLNLALSSQLHDLKSAHAKDKERMEATIIECSTGKANLEEKLKRQEECFRAERKELCKMMTEATENSGLKEKHHLQEQNFRAEKEELCNMLKETEETHKKGIRNLKEEVLRGEESQKKLKLEMKSLCSRHEKELEDAASKLASELGAMEAKKASLEMELMKKEQSIGDNEELAKKREEMGEKHTSEKSRLQTQLGIAQETQRGMKTELSKLKAYHAQEQEKMMMELVGCHQKEAEAESWKERLRRQEERAKSEEGARLKEAAESAENKYREEIRELREELFWTQESEKQLKSEISEMEASHAEEMERLNTDAFEDCNKADEEMALLHDQLEQLEQASRDEKEELCKTLKAAEENYKKEVLKLNEEVSRLQDSLRQVKSESSKLETAHAEELEKMMTKTLDYSQKDAEIADLQEKFQAQGAQLREEKQRLRGWLKNHLDDVRGLKEEFVEAQESHIMHLLHVLAELEVINEMRAEETSAILEELEMLRNEKDTVIEALETEIELKGRGLGLPPHLPTIMEVGEVSAEELSELEKRLAKNASLRRAHSNEFNATLHKLQLAIKPDNLKYIIRKVQKKQDGSIEIKVFSEIHRMSVILGELYVMEEDAYLALHDELLFFMRRFCCSSEIKQVI